mmetsp:Transcript_12100/g.28762  ORF Transcript_12100/g.28762 Transcript_12100/m.28762 type:complete len:364 (-) Transcript_12100:108-1199(-)
MDSEARHLAGALHFNPSSWVRVLQPLEGEHGSLATNELDVNGVDVLRADRDPQHDLRGDLDEVHVERLGNEWEGSRRTQIALNNLDLVILAQELDVERPRNLQRVAQLLSNFLHASVGLNKQGLRREQQGGVSAVNASVLHVLTDGVVDHVTVAGHSIELNLLCSSNILADHHGEILADNGSVQEEILHLLFSGDDPHCSSREHVRRSHKHWEAHLAAEASRLLQGGELRPPRLIHTQSVAQLAEPQAVLAGVNLVHGSAQDTAASSVQPHRQVVRHLPANRDDNTVRILKVVDVLDHLLRQLLEVQSVRLVVVSGHRLRVAVDDNSLATQVSHGPDRGYAAPIELHRRPNAIATAAKNHDNP